MSDLMVMNDTTLNGAPKDAAPTLVTAQSLRDCFLDDCCIREVEMPASLEADLRETRGGPVDELHLLDFYVEVGKLHKVRIPVERWTEAENKGLPMPRGISTYFSLAYLAHEINSQKAGNRPACHLPPQAVPRPKG